MGMFDYIKFSAPCKKCREVINKDWQSKDGKCQLEMIDPTVDESIENIYTDCRKCGTWNEYHRKPKQISLFTLFNPDECTTPMSPSPEKEPCELEEGKELLFNFWREYTNDDDRDMVIEKYATILDKAIILAREEATALARREIIEQVHFMQSPLNESEWNELKVFFDLDSELSKANFIKNTILGKVLLATLSDNIK